MFTRWRGTHEVLDAQQDELHRHRHRRVRLPVAARVAVVVAHDGAQDALLRRPRPPVQHEGRLRVCEQRGRNVRRSTKHDCVVVLPSLGASSCSGRFLRSGAAFDSSPTPAQALILRCADTSGTVPLMLGPLSAPAFPFWPLVLTCFGPLSSVHRPLILLRRGPWSFPRGPWSLPAQAPHPLLAGPSVPTRRTFLADVAQSVVVGQRRHLPRPDVVHQRDVARVGRVASVSRGAPAAAAAAFAQLLVRVHCKHTGTRIGTMRPFAVS